MSVQLVWLKRDLRLEDHAPLREASRRSRCVCLYVYEDSLIEADDFDPAHLNFINQSLAEVRKKLRARGGELYLRRGKVVEVLNQFHRDYQIETLWAHEETSNSIAYRRDRDVRCWARAVGVRLREFPQNGVVRRLESRDGWADRWSERMKKPILSAPQRIQGVTGIEPGAFLTAGDFQISTVARAGLQTGGEQAAERCLGSFLEQRGVNYRGEMSSPVTAMESCSRLSAHLAYGNLSIKRVCQATVERVAELKALRKSGETIEPTWLKSLSSFQGRLRWHCHFMQKLEDEPSIEFRNINRAYDGLREAEFNEAYYQAWCAGTTGYPMVDACMRALDQTGWINFRMRAMLVSFSSYHLWLHWRRPAVHLARLFLDYEPGIHYNQVQMQAGVTGINTVRIYSPIKQVVDQDPQGKFIRKFVPELEGVPDQHLAEPHRMTTMEQTLYGCQIGRDYPHPIVDHKIAYQTARKRMHLLKRSAAAKAEAKGVYQKHGSRRRPRRQSQKTRGTSAKVANLAK